MVFIFLVNIHIFGKDYGRRDDEDENSNYHSHNVTGKKQNNDVRSADLHHSMNVPTEVSLRKIHHFHYQHHQKHYRSYHRQELDNTIPTCPCFHLVTVVLSNQDINLLNISSNTQKLMNHNHHHHHHPCFYQQPHL